MGFSRGVSPVNCFKETLVRNILLFLCLNLFIGFSFCYAGQVKSYLRSDGATVTWYKRCDSNGEARENYSYEIKGQP